MTAFREKSPVARDRDACRSPGDMLKELATLGVPNSSPALLSKFVVVGLVNRALLKNRLAETKAFSADFFQRNPTEPRHGEARQRVFHCLRPGRPVVDTSNAGSLPTRRRAIVFPSERCALGIAGSVEGAFGPNGLLTGHSMGGGEAALASAATQVPAITFNAAGVNLSAYGYEGSPTGQITNYYVVGQGVGLIDPQSPLGVQVPILPMTAPTPGNYLNHSMSSVIPALCNAFSNCGP